MVATIARSGPGFVTSNVRTYDVWGGVRTGASNGGPKGRYVANLGHVQDDESGLIYMRARYYEPESGRFISEDPAMDGRNWYSYAENKPVLFKDYNGKQSSIDDFFDFIKEALTNPFIAAGITAFQLAMMFRAAIKSPAAMTLAIVMTSFIAMWFYDEINNADGNNPNDLGAFVTLSSLLAMYSIPLLAEEGKDLALGLGGQVKAFFTVYSISLMMFMRLEFGFESL